MNWCPIRSVHMLVTPAFHHFIVVAIRVVLRRSVWSKQTNGITAPLSSQRSREIFCQPLPARNFYERKDEAAFRNLEQHFSSIAIEYNCPPGLVLGLWLTVHEFVPTQCPPFDPESSSR